MKKLIYTLLIMIVTIFNCHSQNIDSLLAKHPILKPIFNTKMDSSEILTISFKENMRTIFKEPSYIVSSSKEEDMDMLEIEPMHRHKLSYNRINQESYQYIDSLFNNDILTNYEYTGDCESLDNVTGFSVILKKGNRFYYYIHRDCRMDFSKGGKQGELLLQLLFLLGT